MKRSFKISFIIGFTGALLLAQGCAQKIQSTTTPMTQRNAVPSNLAGPAPAGTSIAAVAPSLLGTFKFRTAENFGCMVPGFGFVPQVANEEELYEETLVIEDRRVTMIDSYPATGCVINFVFALRGVDGTRLSIQNAQISAFLNGSPDTAGTCQQHYDPVLAVSALTYEYLASGYQIVLQTPPDTRYCDAASKSAFVFNRAW
ncbi:MAG: hypothetical protein NDJ89_17640 [Oligoflexia bacterium]|nr:hypothetical protein [Oligoflexia bacterium]